MSVAPPEVSPIMGDNGNNILFVTQAAVNAYNAGPGWNWSNLVLAEGGNDTIVRDRTGDYNTANGSQGGDVHIFGGSGHDMVSYVGASTGVSVNLAMGLANQFLPAGLPPGAINFGIDHLYEIEGAVGSTHADSMLGGGNADTFHGHDGNDTIDGAGGNDTVYGGTGHDTIAGGTGNDKLHGDTGNDIISGGDGVDWAYGGDGNDTINGGGDGDFLYGDKGNDSINGGLGNDVINAGDGNDTVHGGFGNDQMTLGDGSNTAYGASGNDVFAISGFGNNSIHGGLGSDKAVFGNAAVTVNLLVGNAWRGTDGIDTLTGIENAETGNGHDVVFGSDYANTLQSGGGNDWVSAFAGNDTVYGGTGNDLVEGGADNDWIDGQWNNDTLNGDAGNDTIFGGSGQDTIRGGAGSDTMNGGANADTFVWKTGDLGLDRITGFNLNEDMFHFGPGFLAQGTASQVLMATNMYGLGTVLLADTAASDWEMIAILDGVGAEAVNARIANGTIFDVEVNGALPGGGGGGLAGMSPGLASTMDWSMIA